MKLLSAKTTIKNLCCILVIVLSLSACKKDALTVKEEKEYFQVNKPVSANVENAGESLTLKPGGAAAINPGGDIIWTATYKISGNKITVKAGEINTIFKFTVISNEEIHGENGQVLKLVKP